MVRTGNPVPTVKIVLQVEVLDHDKTGRCGDTTGGKE
jgi:hypothetical protein